MLSQQALEFLKMSCENFTYLLQNAVFTSDILYTYGAHVKNQLNDNNLSSSDSDQPPLHDSALKLQRSALINNKLTTYA